MADDQEAVEHPEHASGEGNLNAAAAHVEAGAKQALAEAGLDREGPSIATAALVGVGVAILEPEFIPGMLIGAGAVLAPKLVPALGGLLRPLVKGVVKAGYSATTAVREAAAQAREQIEDIVAEARHEAEGAQPAAQPSSAERPSRRQRRPNRPPAPATNL